MTKQDLSSILKRMVANAQKGTILTQYHLFGILYVDEIKNIDCTADDIAEDAGLSRKYGIEIRKGMRLAKHVTIK